MEELFINKTKITQKEYDIFLQVYQEEYAMSESLYTGYYLIFFTICLVASFIEKEIILGIATLFGLGIYIWYKFFRPVKLAKKQNERVLKKCVNTAKFYKKYFKVENEEGESTTFYFKIYKVIETEKFFYIFISSEYAFILSKKGFEDEKVMEFSKFIKKKTLGKYKKKIKNK